MADEHQGWFITGVSSGLGRGIAIAALNAGHRVVGTLRKPEQHAEFEALAPGRSHALTLDVTDAEAVADVVNRAHKLMGRLDVVVNNAGYGLIGAIEELSEDEAKRQIDTNFFGVFRVAKAAIPLLKAQGGGHIINIGSVASAHGFPSMGLYAASKFAVAGMTQSMARELAPFGIKATVVEPGGFRTNFGTTSMAWAASPLADYAPTTARMREGVTRPAQPAPNDPLRGGRAIVALAGLADPPVHLALGADGRRYVRDATARRLAEYDQYVEISESTTASD